MAPEHDLLLNNMDESLVLLDPDLRILSLTKPYQQRFEKYFDLKPEPGMLLLDCLPPEERPHAERLYRAVLEGKCDEREVEVAAPDGVSEIHLVHLKPALDAEGEIIGILASVVDITDRRHMEEEIRLSKDGFGSLVTDLVEAQQKLEQSHERFERLVQASSDSILELDIATNALYISDGFTRSFGHQLPGPERNRKFLQSLVHPDDQDAMVSSFKREIADPATEQRTARYRLRKTDGDYALVVNHMVILRDEQGRAYRTLGTLRDITREHYYQHLDELENRIMARIIRENPDRENILTDYMQALEEISPVMRVSVMEVRESRLYTLAAPSLPKAYCQKMDGLGIGENAGSCGASAWRREPVVVTNVLENVLWADYRHLAKKYHFRSCWSYPIINSQGEVVATFAGYFREERQPTELEQVVIERTLQLVGLILDRYNVVTSLEASNERYDLISRASRDALYDWNISADKVYWGEGFARLFGHQQGKDKAFSSADWNSLIHPDDRSEYAARSAHLLSNARASHWEMEYRFHRADGTYAYVEEEGYLIRDQRKQSIRVVGMLRDVSDFKLSEIRQEQEQVIGRLFTEELELGTALGDTLRYLTDQGQFPGGEIWLVDSHEERLNFATSFARNDCGQRFYGAVGTQGSLKKGEGIPGAVWKTGQQQSWDDIHLPQKNNGFVRQRAAAEAGLRAASGVPLVNQGRVIGVLVFISDRVIGDDRTLIEPYIGLGNFMGAEICRKQQEHQMHLLFHSSPDIMAIASPKGHFVKVNPALCELLGYTEPEILGRPFEEFIHPEDTQATLGELEENLLGRQARNFVNRYRTRSGDYRWISWGSSDLFGEEGCFFAYGRDISATVKLQELLDSASRMARVGSWEYHIRDGAIYWSDVTRKIHEVGGDFQPDLDTVITFYKAGDSRDRIQAAVAQLVADGVSYDLELQIVTVKGREKWVRTIGSAEFADGECVRVYGAFQDIDARKSVEMRLKAMANNVPGVIYQYQLLADGTDRISYVSEGAREIWGLDPDRDLGDMSKVWEGVIKAGDAEYLHKTIIDSARDLSPWHARWRNVKPSGELRYHEGFGNPYRLADGTTVWDSLLLDVTNQHRLEDLVERSTQMARIGSWELNFIDSNSDRMYCSPMTREILEVGEDYDPTYSAVLGFYMEESRERIERAMQILIDRGEDFDLELQITTAKGKARWIRCIGKSERIAGRCSKIYGSFQDIDEHMRVQIDLARKNQYMAAASNVIGMLLHAEDWFNVLHSIFNLTAETMEIDRICYLERHAPNVTGEVLVSQKFEWARESLKRHEDDLRFQNIPIQAVDPEIYQQLSEGKAVRAYASRLPDGDFKQSMVEFDTQAVLFMPVIIGSQLYGILSFDDCRGERDWTENETWLLDSVSSSLAAAIGRYNSQRSLEQAFEERNAILESIGDGFATLATDWTVTYWNRQAEVLTGVSRDDILGRNLWAIFGDAEDTDFYRHYHEVMVEGESMSFEDYYAELDMWFDISVYPSDTGISIFFQDITERRASQRQLQESNERFEKVSEATNDAIFDYDLLGGNTYWGQGFSKLLGVDLKILEPSYDALLNRIHPEDRARAEQEIRVAVHDSNKASWALEYRFQRADNTYAHVVDRAIFIRDKEGSATRIVGAIRDISDRKRHEEALVRLNRQLKDYTEKLESSNSELEQFAYIASHDLQEPLRMVSSFLKLLETRYTDELDDEAREYIDFAVDGAMRMKRIILDLLNYSRVGKYEDELGAVDVGELLGEIQTLFHAQIEEKRGRLTWGKMPTLNSYRSPLLQILQNLIGNAFKYTRTGVPPVIRVEARDQGENWEFSVQDNGMGIEPKYFDKVFVIFQRLHAKDEYEGTGIGLSIVKKLVDGFGGRIWVESKPEVGSIFHFTLPKSNHGGS